MPDLYLEAIMHGDFPHKKMGVALTPIKNKFEIAIENAINKYVETLNVEDTAFEDHKRHLDRIKEEIKRESLSPKLKNQILGAFDFIMAKGSENLNKELFERTMKEFQSLNEYLQNVDLNEPFPDFKITPEVNAGLLQLALLKYQKSEYPLSLSLFVLLTALNPINADYWFRQGIVCQKCQEYEMAIQYYERSLELDSELLGARLLTIECLTNTKQLDLAKSSFEQIKKMTEGMEMSEIWTEYMADIDSIIQNR